MPTKRPSKCTSRARTSRGTSPRRCRFSPRASARCGSRSSVDLRLAELPVLERYKLLIGLVIPRPIAWISTRSANGVANCAPFSFFNVFSEEPPLCVIGINPRKDGLMKHSLKNIRRTKEFVVNLVDEATANAMHVSSYEFPEDVSEFEKTGLSTAPALTVQHPRIAEAAASLECRLYQLLEISGARHRAGAGGATRPARGGGEPARRERRDRH